ncbi:hypothetical protein SLE2022_194250 [Rubroshorea leprosula]
MSTSGECLAETESLVVNLETPFFPETEKEEAEVEKGSKDMSEKEKENENFKEKSSEDLEGESQNKSMYGYPFRPHVKDCSFYLRTGYCKYGFHCKFNHPERSQGNENDKAGIFGQTEGGTEFKDVKEEGTETDNILEQLGQIECKYYLTAGGCKYGKDCRYKHSNEKSHRYIEKSDVPSPELNFLGLPIRRLEKECPFYMRTGSCAYGLNCRFNHPDPTAAEGSDMESSFVGNNNQKLDKFSLFADSKPSLESFSNMALDDPAPYLDNKSFYVPGMHINSEWTRHQVKMGDPHSAFAMNNAMKSTSFSKFHLEQMNIREFPERPGNPDCAYFIKTGYCKFKSACKFNHPKMQPSKSPARTLNNSGLPLRPGRKVCQHYERYGICKFGQNCYFHHPENCGSSAFSAESALF